MSDIENKNNVVSLLSAKNKQTVEPSTTDDNQDEGLSFEEIIKKNKEKKDKLEEERRKANKSVIRSYNLKK